MNSSQYKYYNAIIVIKNAYIITITNNKVFVLCYLPLTLWVSGGKWKSQTVTQTCFVRCPPTSLPHLPCRFPESGHHPPTVLLVCGWDSFPWASVLLPPTQRDSLWSSAAVLLLPAGPGWRATSPLQGLCGAVCRRPGQAVHQVRLTSWLGFNVSGGLCASCQI